MYHLPRLREVRLMKNMKQKDVCAIEGCMCYSEHETVTVQQV